MQKTITKLLILTIAFTFVLSASYLFAAWTGPIEPPPGGNTPTPIHVGTTNQVKNGGLSLNALSVFGGGYFQGNVGVGVVTPTEVLDVGGNIKGVNIEAIKGIKIGNTSDTDAGTIRWTGTDFEGYNGTQWVSFTATENNGGTTIGEECVQAGGVWQNIQNICYFGGGSCPNEWVQQAQYGSTQAITCVDNSYGIGSDGASCNGSSCRTDSHYRNNGGIETCWYEDKFQEGDPSRGENFPCGSRGHTCYAIQTEVGCVKVQ